MGTLVAAAMRPHLTRAQPRPEPDVLQTGGRRAGGTLQAARPPCIHRAVALGDADTAYDSARKIEAPIIEDGTRSDEIEARPRVALAGLDSVLGQSFALESFHLTQSRDKTNGHLQPSGSTPTGSGLATASQSRPIAQGTSECQARLGSSRGRRARAPFNTSPTVRPSRRASRALLRAIEQITNRGLAMKFGQVFLAAPCSGTRTSRKPGRCSTT